MFIGHSALMNADRPWFVCRLKPHGLEAARVNLERQKFTTFMPMQEVTIRTRRGLRRKDRPLFPGYLFFSYVTDAINWRAVSNTRGVAQILTSSGCGPAILPRDVIAGLLECTNEEGSLLPLEKLAPGEKVRIVNGPMFGWLAQVVAADDAERVSLLVDMMGRQTALETGRKDLEKLH